MIVYCPECGKEVEYEGNSFRPFCSERCKILDLGKWASGDFRIPVVSEDEEEDGTPKIMESDPTES
jgi:endogenous inhibitor of DNA gyrase (YacG/DUF329 family)